MGIILNSEKGERVHEMEAPLAFAMMQSLPKVVIWGERVFTFAGMNSVRRDSGKWYPRAIYNEASTYYLTTTLMTQL